MTTIVGLAGLAYLLKGQILTLQMKFRLYKGDQILKRMEKTKEGTYEYAKLRGQLASERERYIKVLDKKIKLYEMARSLEK